MVPAIGARDSENLNVNMKESVIAKIFVLMCVTHVHVQETLLY